MRSCQGEHLADEAVHEAGKTTVFFDLSAFSYQEQVYVTQIGVYGRVGNIRQRGYLHIIRRFGRRRQLVERGHVLLLFRLVLLRSDGGWKSWWRVVLVKGQTTARDDDHGVVVVIETVIKGEIAQTAVGILAELVEEALKNIVADLAESPRAHLNQRSLTPEDTREHLKIVIELGYSRHQLGAAAIESLFALVGRVQKQNDAVSIPHVVQLDLEERLGIVQRR